MVNFETLSIAGYVNRAVQNTFLRQSQGADHLAVVFPGLGYSVGMPVLYYPGQLLAELGADVLLVDTRYNRIPEYEQAPDEEKNRWLEADADAAQEAALSQGRYRRVTLVGKSIGTLAAGHVLHSHPDLPNLACAWLTPLVKSAQLRQRIKSVRHRALFVIGTADPHYSPALVEELRVATGGEVMAIQGANHSLEIAGDIVKSVEIMREVVERIKGFLS
jgi:pimeloyl-ACP methyl ester carboxylesterase